MVIRCIKANNMIRYEKKTHTKKRFYYRNNSNNTENICNFGISKEINLVIPNSTNKVAS